MQHNEIQNFMYVQVYKSSNWRSLGGKHLYILFFVLKQGSISCDNVFE
jgi:hypothetical protein